MNTNHLVFKLISLIAGLFLLVYFSVFMRAANLRGFISSGGLEFSRQKNIQLPNQALVYLPILLMMERPIERNCMITA